MKRKLKRGLYIRYLHDGAKLDVSWAQGIMGNFEYLLARIRRLEAQLGIEDADDLPLDDDEDADE